MKQKTFKIKLPSYWSAAIIDHDYSTLEPDARKEITKLFIDHDLWDRKVDRTNSELEEFRGHPCVWVSEFTFFPNADLIEGQETPDDMNPRFLFNNTYTPLLVKIASGEIDAQALALLQLEHRGRNAKGEFVGYKKVKA